MASFPGSVKSFASRANGGVIDASHVNDLQDEVNAIEDGYLNATAHLNSSNSTAANLSVLGGSTLTGLHVTSTASYDSSVTCSTHAQVNGVFSVVGGSILFPAAQVASANANGLDDYEENTWTPQLTFGGASVGMTFSVQAGWYVKVGQLVVVGGSFTLTNKGSSTGNASITGLPFNSIGTAGVAGAVYFARTIALTTITHLDGSVPTGGTAINLAGDATVANETHFQNTTACDGFVGAYRASA